MYGGFRGCCRLVKTVGRHGRVRPQRAVNVGVADMYIMQSVLASAPSLRDHITAQRAVQLHVKQGSGTSPWMRRSCRLWFRGNWL